MAKRRLNEPLLPLKPIEPKDFSIGMIISKTKIEYTPIFTISLGEQQSRSVSLADFEDKIAKVVAGRDKTKLIIGREDHYYDGQYINDVYFVISEPVEVENKNYEWQLKFYEQTKKRYEDEMKQYAIKMKEYKAALDNYDIRMLAYLEAKRKEIDEREQKLLARSKTERKKT